jgi:hypothetical protein
MFEVDLPMGRERVAGQVLLVGADQRAIVSARFLPLLTRNASAQLARARDAGCEVDDRRHGAA